MQFSSLSSYDVEFYHEYEPYCDFTWAKVDISSVTSCGHRGKDRVIVSSEQCHTLRRFQAHLSQVWSQLAEEAGS